MSNTQERRFYLINDDQPQTFSSHSSMQYQSDILFISLKLKYNFLNAVYPPLHGVSPVPTKFVRQIRGGSGFPGNARKFFGEEAVARVANFPAKNCCPAKLEGDGRKAIKQEGGKKPRKRLWREGMKILSGGGIERSRDTLRTGWYHPGRFPSETRRRSAGYTSMNRLVYVLQSTMI